AGPLRDEGAPEGNRLRLDSRDSRRDRGSRSLAARFPARRLRGRRARHAMTSRAFQKRCVVLCSVLATGLSLLSVRLVKIQAWDRKHYRDEARRTFEWRETLPGLRGTIVDRNEEILAKSMPVGTVWVNATHLKDPKTAAWALAYERVSTEPGWEALDGPARDRRIKAERGVLLKEYEQMQEGPGGKEPGEVFLDKALAQAVNILARPLGLKREDMRAKIKNSIAKGRDEFILVKDLPSDA